MRGIGRVGGKSFKVPPAQGGGKSYDPFDISSLLPDELPVAPTTTPITDDFGIRWASDTDPRDCAAYPASPYCGGNPIRLGPPIGYDYEIKANECEICVYLYPVIAFLKLTPTVFCYRQPGCRPDPTALNPTVDVDKAIQFPRIKPNPWMTPECAEQRNWFIDRANSYNRGQVQGLKADVDYFAKVEGGVEKGTEETDLVYEFSIFPTLFYTSSPDLINRKAFWVDATIVSTNYRLLWKGGGYRPARYRQITNLQFSDCYEARKKPTPPPPPPPYGDEKGDGGTDNNRKGNDKGGKPVCCNDCKDAADRASKILSENQKMLKEFEDIKKILGKGVIKVPKIMDSTLSNNEGTAPDLTEAIAYFGKLFATRLGTGRYPIEVPESLLTGVGDKVQNVESLTDFHYWFTNQIDALVGEFPIEIEVKDIDPLKEGDQKKRISLPNIAEAIAETYGLTIKSAVNQELELNMLLRLAAEMTATKNGVIVAQDYARANATFLGYKGNYKARETTYNFDFASVNLDQPIIMEKLLKTNKGYVQGWENEDKETAVGFLQKLMFAAGIIKAVFFRGKGLTKQFSKEANSMSDDAKNSEKDWEKFLRQINNENSMYNSGFVEKPDIKEDPKDPREP